jgi:hypothetical protein
MTMRMLRTVAALLIAGGTAPRIALAAAPDIAACPEPEMRDAYMLQRTKPLAVPRAFAGMIRADMNRYAVSTLGGGTVCVDTRDMEGTAEDHALSADKRFLSFTWQGYETGGHIVVDRSGAGQVVETGAEPSFSPSGKRFAAIEWSESGFGALNAFGAWQVEPEGVKTLALIEDMPAMTAWKIDRWVGEDCIELSGVASDQVPDDPREIDSAPRTRFVAAQMAKPSGPAAWKLLLGVETCPKR